MNDPLLPEITPPTILELPEDIYHRCPGVSKHDLDQFDISPLHYITSKSAGFVASEPFQIGTLTHTAILEPHRFSDSYVLAPDCDKRSKDGKERWAIAEEKASLEGKILVKEENLAHILAMRNAVKEHRSAAAALSSGGLVEPSLFAINSEFNVLMRARPDMLPKGNAIVDVKTCQLGKGGYAKFARSVANFRYHVQAAWYLDICKALGMDKSCFVFIVVEKEAPYAVATYELDSESVEAGRQEYRRNLEFFAKCLANDEWPGYSQNVEVINLPKWAIRQAAAA